MTDLTPAEILAALAENHQVSQPLMEALVMSTADAIEFFHADVMAEDWQVAEAILGELRDRGFDVVPREETK